MNYAQTNKQKDLNLETPKQSAQREKKKFSEKNKNF